MVTFCHYLFIYFFYVQNAFIVARIQCNLVIITVSTQNQSTLILHVDLVMYLLRGGAFWAKVTRVSFFPQIPSIINITDKQCVDWT